MYPSAVGNIVGVRLLDGRCISERIDYPHGHARQPLSDAEIETKFHLLADPVIGRERAQNALTWLWKLEQAAGLAPLLDLMRVQD